MEYDEIDGKICNFNMYIKQSLDLLKDAFKWKVMSEQSDSQEMKNKYKIVSDTLFDLFMTEHNNIGAMFKETN